MRKSINKPLALMAAAVFMSWGAISCSDDDDVTTQLEIGDNLVTEGIEAEIDGKVLELNIVSNGDWTITISEDGEDWVDVAATSGTGSQSVPMSIDPNYESTEGRSATITITSGDVVRTIQVTQYPTYNGEDVSNATDVEFGIAENKGVGMGYNLNKLRTINPVLNLGAIKELQNIDSSEYGGYFSYYGETEATAENAMIDSIEVKTDKLTIKASLDVSYGIFKLSISGGYHGDESKSYYDTQYNYACKYNIANATTDMPSIIEEYREAMAAPSDTVEKVKWGRLLLTKGFKAAMSRVESAHASGSGFASAVKSMVNAYGPVVITDCELGGNISLTMKYNLDSIYSSMGVDDATATLSLNSVFKLDGSVSVDYQRTGLEIMENSAFKYVVSGGTQETIDSVANILATKRTQGDEGLYNQLPNKISSWSKSLDANEGKTLAITHMELYAIWEFFEDYDVREDVMDWVKTNYTDETGALNELY